MSQIGANTMNASATTQSQMRSKSGSLNRMGAEDNTMIRRTIRQFACVVVALLWAFPAQAQTGTLLPNVPGQWFDNNGDPCNACLLYAYTAGTTTPLDTYSDAALTIANANPVVLDSAGRATVYLSASTYKFVLKSAAGATIWTRDNVGAVPFTTLASTFNDLCNGRLTGTSGTPIPAIDNTPIGTLYFTPYRGNRCAIYDGTTWNLLSFSETSLSLASSTNATNYDVFAYSNNGTFALERLAWSTDTARATALATQDGVLVKSGDTTRRYLGTYRTISTTATADTKRQRFVWNYYNRVPRALEHADPTASWNYTTATIRQARATATNQVEVVNGWIEESVDLGLHATFSNTNASVAVSVGIGADSTTAYSSSAFVQEAFSPAANVETGLLSRVNFIIGVGFHYFAWLEVSAATGTTTFYGTTGNIRSGLIGTWRC